MKKKAILLDFCGTIVHEDGKAVDLISKIILDNSKEPATIAEIKTYWWKSFSDLFNTSFDDSFKLQRELEFTSIKDTIHHFKSNANALELSNLLFEYWIHPDIFPDSQVFLGKNKVPTCIVSNIDRGDILKAIDYHGLHFDLLITSEDVRSYKPRPEIFMKALQQLSFTKDEVIHIGDSLSSDIAGSRNVGISNVWVNRNNKSPNCDILPDHICNNLIEILDLDCF